MAPKFVLVAVVSALVLLLGPNASTVSAYLAPDNWRSYYDDRPIIIRGAVLCKTCKVPGHYVEGLDASTVGGAVVRVSCFDKNWKLISVTTACDGGGGFYMEWTDVASFDPNQCRAYLDWSPLSFCNVPMYSPGTYGSYLTQLVPPPRQKVYTAGFLYFDRPNGTCCPVNCCG